MGLWILPICIIVSIYNYIKQKKKNEQAKIDKIKWDNDYGSEISKERKEILEFGKNISSNFEKYNCK